MVRLFSTRNHKWGETMANVERDTPVKMATQWIYGPEFGSLFGSAVRLGFHQPCHIFASLIDDFEKKVINRQNHKNLSMFEIDFAHRRRHFIMNRVVGWPNQVRYSRIFWNGDHVIKKSIIHESRNKKSTKKNPKLFFDAEFSDKSKLFNTTSTKFNSF